MTIVLDSSAIINKIDFLSGKLITAPAVIDEVRGKKLNEKISLALDINSIEQRLPKEKFLGEVHKATREANDSLSQVDMQIIALALEFKAEIATDDYGIQNVAAKLGLKTIPVAERGIKKILHWQYYCVGCKRNYELSQGACDACGAQVKRKAKK